MRHTLKFTSTGNRFVVDTNSSLQDMKVNCPVFFKHPHLADEKYTIYRGQLICHGTVTFSDNIPREKAVVYLYLIDSLTDKRHPIPDLFCVSAATDIKTVEQGEAIIDEILRINAYDYDHFRNFE